MQAEQKDTTCILQVKKWASSNVPAAMRPQTENYVVSRYIEDPLLIGGKKFDLRIYVVVLNYKPLQVRHATAPDCHLMPDCSSSNIIRQHHRITH